MFLITAENWQNKKRKKKKREVGKTNEIQTETKGDNDSIFQKKFLFKIFTIILNGHQISKFG